VVIREGAGAGSEHPVDGELILGRDHASADLVIDDPGVSRRHARVLADRGGVMIEDLGSSNGTYVNGRRISGPVEVGPGDDLQLGDTVVGLAGAPPTVAIPAPRRLAPHPQARTNLPALAAVFLGPLSVLLVFLSAGGFFIALPCGIAAIVLGAVGLRNADRRQDGHRGLARIGRFTGILGAVIAVVAVIVFVVVATALHSTEHSVGGLISRIKDEINHVRAPNVNVPNVKAPNPPSPGSSGGTPPPGQ
jgi:FHA domain-containing protein